MASSVKLPLHIALPGIDVLLTDKFFGGKVFRPPMLHTHPCYELICVQKEKEKYFIIVPPLVEHMATDIQGDVLAVDSLLFSFMEEDEAYLDDITQELRHLQQETKIPDTFGGTAHIESLKEALTDTRPGLYALMQAHLRLLFVQLTRESCNVEQETKLKKTLDEERLGLLEEYFHLNLTDPQCSKQQLAQLIGVSERQLSRILMEKYHAGFSAILLRMRMNLAEAMLRNGETSASAIAEATGYVSAEAFKRAYKSWAGHRFGQDNKERHEEREDVLF